MVDALVKNRDDKKNLREISELEELPFDREDFGE